MSQITVIRIKKIEGKEMLRAFADVAVGEVTVNGIRLMEDQKGDWLGLPQTSYDDKNGKKKYTPVVEISEGLKKSIKEEILKEYKNLN